MLFTVVNFDHEVLAIVQPYSAMGHPDGGSHH